MPLPRLPLHAALDRLGAPPRLPAGLDRLSEAWWSRTPATRWIVSALMVVGLLAVVGRGATRSAWGPPVPVLVASADLPAGTPLTPDLVGRATWPADLVPVDPLDHAEGRLRTAVVAGQVVTARHVAPDLASMVPAERVAVPVPIEGLPDVQPGHLVDVVSTSPDGTGGVLASRVDVLAVDAGWAWLAVPEDAAGAVATAATAGRLGLALRARAEAADHG